MKIKHILLILLFIGLIYLDILWFNNFEYNEKENNKTHNFFWILLNIILSISILTYGISYLYYETYFFEKIKKILNTKIS